MHTHRRMHMHTHPYLPIGFSNQFYNLNLMGHHENHTNVLSKPTSMTMCTTYFNTDVLQHPHVGMCLQTHTYIYVSE